MNTKLSHAVYHCNQLSTAMAELVAEYAKLDGVKDALTLFHQSVMTATPNTERANAEMELHVRRIKRNIEALTSGVSQRSVELAALVQDIDEQCPRLG